MSNDNQQDEIIRFPVERHEWPDELETKRLKKSNRRLKILSIFLVVLCFLFGWVFGSISPVPYFHALKDGVNAISSMDSKNKFDEMLKVLTTEWFFADEIEDVKTTLTDNALYGMTNNEIDIHTSYMSQKEVESFTQNINRNYVGIGVQYINTDGLFLIERVFKNSPAEKAGVLSGDIIYEVDGIKADTLTTTELSDKVKGEENTTVHMGFERAGEIIYIDIVREAVNTTVFGEVRDGGIGYLEIMQFGDTTAQEALGYIDDFKANNVEKLVIDLRGDGGGYLDSLRAVASLFLPGDIVVMEQVYSDGSVVPTKTVSGLMVEFHPIILLIDENTASAAEAFTLALKENRSDVTTVGKTTYGKGTVQITKPFTDGSALKYTTSKWVSGDGVWINNVGIEPDYDVDLDASLNEVFFEMEDNTEYSFDSVSDFTKKAQLGLKFLDYDVDREDGYFSNATEQAITSFQQAHGLDVTGTLNQETYHSIISNILVEWNHNSDKDAQYQKAVELLK